MRVEEVHVGGKVKRGRCMGATGLRKLFITKAPDASVVLWSTAARYCSTNVRIQEAGDYLDWILPFFRQQMVEHIKYG